jgi:hypothetical protein
MLYPVLCVSLFWCAHGRLTSEFMPGLPCVLRMAVMPGNKKGDPKIAFFY